MRHLTVEQLISLWPKVRDLADDLSVAEQTVYSWKRRGYVPASNARAIVDAARARNISLTLAEVMEATERHETGAAA